jgi:hypothetical protein
VVYALYVGLSSEASTVYLYRTGDLLWIGSTLAVLLIQIADGYQVPALRSALRDPDASVLSAWSIAFAMIAAAGILPAIRTCVLAESGLRPGIIHGAVGLIIVRNVVAYGIRRWARNGVMERRAVIVGGGEHRPRA